MKRAIVLIFTFLFSLPLFSQEELYPKKLERIGSYYSELSKAIEITLVEKGLPEMKEYSLSLLTTRYQDYSYSCGADLCALYTTPHILKRECDDGDNKGKMVSASAIIFIDRSLKEQFKVSYQLNHLECPQEDNRY